MPFPLQKKANWKESDSAPCVSLHQRRTLFSAPSQRAGRVHWGESGIILLMARWRVLLLLILLFPRLAPPRPLVIAGPPQVVQTAHPIVGIHTRLTDEVEEWKIQRSLQMVREMGATWIVEFFPWSYIEPFQPGEFTWSHSDAVVNHAEAQGLTIIARLGTVPEWARPDPDREPTTWTFLDRERIPDFGAFVNAFVARYRGQVNHIIIWNEPNLSFEWGYRPVDPAGYVELLARPGTWNCWRPPALPPRQRTRISSCLPARWPRPWNRRQARPG